VYYRQFLYLWSRDVQTNTYTHTHKHRERQRERDREREKMSGTLRKGKRVHEMKSGAGEHLWIERVEEVNEMSLKRHLS
jgi:hypothetical protein